MSSVVTERALVKRCSLTLCLDLGRPTKASKSKSNERTAQVERMSRRLVLPFKELASNLSAGAVR